MGNMNNRTSARNSKFSNKENENTSNSILNTFSHKQPMSSNSSVNTFSANKQDSCFSSTRLSQDKRNFPQNKISQKVRASSSSLNRKSEDKFMFRPPTHSTMHMPTPKGQNHQIVPSAPSDPSTTDMASKNKISKETDSGAKSKRNSLQRIKRVSKIPSGKREGLNVQGNRSTSRGKQLSAKNRLVYKKDSMKNLNSNKNDMSLGLFQQPSSLKGENKENDFSDANTNFKLNRTSAGKDSQKNIKSMNGIRKLYTLKANSSNRRLESQSYRDLNYKHKNSECPKGGKFIQNSATIYNASINNKKKHSRNKVSTSETPKLRSYHEHRIKKVDVGDKENTKPSNNLTSNYDTRMLKKPPNPGLSNKQPKQPSFAKKPSSSRDKEN